MIITVRSRKTIATDRHAVADRAFAQVFRERDAVSPDLSTDPALVARWMEFIAAALKQDN